MPSVFESAGGAGTPLEDALRAGLENISYEQEITFTKYIKLILPLDGFVFWVRSDLVGHSALIGAAQFNATTLNQPLVDVSPAETRVVRGSIHVAASKIMEDEQTYSINRIVFTSEQPIHEGFEDVGPHVIWLGEFMGIRFSFSSTKNYYRQAGLYHYMGDAIYPFMESQIVDTLDGFDSHDVIVSNSLPIWLYLNNYTPFYGVGNVIPLYPSHLVQPNIVPPFAAVHVEPGSTEAIASAPYLTKNMSHYQQTQETVRVSFYGVRNWQIMNFMDCINQYSYDYNYIGLLNCPVVQDEKQGQSEISALAQKKSATFRVSYTQNTARQLTRQIICQSIQSYEALRCFPALSSPGDMPSL